MTAIMISATRSSKYPRRAAPEAGAWDYLSVLLNPEELTLKVDAMARLKLEIDRALEESAEDPTSGLYTVRGLERRAREPTLDEVRRRAALAWVARGLGLASKGDGAAVLPAA